MFDETELLPLSLDAKLTGLSHLAFKIALIERHLVDYQPDGDDGRFYIDRQSLETAMGRKITGDEIRNAYRALKPRREYQKSYRRAMRNHIMYRAEG
jgi:hypothetical protein